MPSSIYFANRVIYTPGVYSQVDASGLDSKGLSASGIVALIGTATGGKPYTAINGVSDFVTLTQTAQIARQFISGDLFEAASMAFNPSNDRNIQGGAQAVVAMKVNPDTQATLSLANGNVVVTSQNWGAFTNNITLSLQAGSQSGQLLTITHGALTETADNLDADDAASVVAWINANSQLVTAVQTAAAKLANMAATPLTGGTDGVATFADWQNCLNLLKQIRVNTVVPLTTDPAVASATDAHCAYMCGAGNNERDAFVGIGSKATPGALAKKTDILAQVQALNTRNLRCVPQGVIRYNSAGVLTTFAPYFTAVLGAGMQAGGAPGLSLTHKYINAVGTVQDKSWNTVDDSNEMIAGGVLFLETRPNAGIRWVRNVTAYLQDNNSAFSDGGVNCAVNYAVYSVREAVDFAIGQPLFANTINAIKAVMSGTLRALVEDKTISAYLPPEIEPDPDNPDTLLVALSIAPQQPINFIKTTIHLQTATQIAAAAPAA